MKAKQPKAKKAKTKQSKSIGKPKRFTAPRPAVEGEKAIDGMGLGETNSPGPKKAPLATKAGSTPVKTGSSPAKTGSGPAKTGYKGKKQPALKSGTQMLPKGSVILNCETMTPEGKGVVNWQGQTLQVSGVLPGERAAANVVRKKFSTDVRVTAIENPSPNRVKPPCPYAGTCGGCQLQHMSLTAQYQFKFDQVKYLMLPFGETQPIMTMDNPLRYRNKSHTTFSQGPRGQLQAGIYAENSHDVVPVEACLVQTTTADAIIKTIKVLLPSFKLQPYDEDSGMGHLRHVLIKTGFESKQVMVVLVVSTHQLPSKNNLVKALLQAHPEITTIVMNVNPNKTSMVLGPNEVVLHGKGTIDETLCGLKFRISPKSFFQINPIQTAKLYDAAIEMAGFSWTDTVVDAYCGIGTIGMLAAKHVKTVIGVELNKDAVADAQENAKVNGIKNIRFVQADAGAHLLKMAEANETVDVLLMDPPRSGSDVAFLEAVATIAPKKIVYISCNPQTQARDVKILVEKGYTVERIQPVDMFPFTFHVESVVKLVKK